MSRYVCGVCGYVYDEAVEKVPFEQLPSSWKCPVCGAGKDMFEKEAEKEEKKVEATTVKEAEDLREMSAGELSAICSSLARGCEKQYRASEAALFTTLAQYYASKVKLPKETSFQELRDLVQHDLEEEFPSGNVIANKLNDRGAKRVLTWGEKVSKVIKSLLLSYDAEGIKSFKEEKIWVCDICGFIYVGEVPPAICPICKVPSLKILEVK